jgi:hypothetical protein
MRTIMTDSDLTNGQLYEFIEHKMRVIKVEPDEDDTRLTLKCMPECCSKQFKMKFKLTISDFELMLDKKIIKKVSARECLLLT